MISFITNLVVFSKQGKAHCWHVDVEVDDGKGLSEKVDEEMERDLAKKQRLSFLHNTSFILH